MVSSPTFAFSFSFSVSNTRSRDEGLSTRLP